MAWETEKLTRTLFLVRHARGGGKVSYTIHPFHRVTSINGENSYMEPNPMMFMVNGIRGSLTFDNVEYIDEPATARTSTAGDLQLTNGKYLNVRSKIGGATGP